MGLCLGSLGVPKEVGVFLWARYPCRPTPRALGGFYGGGFLFMGEVPLYQKRWRWLLKVPSIFGVSPAERPLTHFFVKDLPPGGQTFCSPHRNPFRL